MVGWKEETSWCPCPRRKIPVWGKVTQDEIRTAKPASSIVDQGQQATTPHPNPQWWSSQAPQTGDHKIWRHLLGLAMISGTIHWNHQQKKRSTNPKILVPKGATQTQSKKDYRSSAFICWGVQPRKEYFEGKIWQGFWNNQSLHHWNTRSPYNNGCESQQDKLVHWNIYLLCSSITTINQAGASAWSYLYDTR